MRWSELLLTVLLVKILCTAGVRACQQDEAETCGQCIQADSSCSWCSRTGFLGPRCGSKDKLEAAGCSTSEIESPNTEVTVIRNDPVTDGVNGLGAIQVQPQRMHLRLRPKEKKTVKLTFRAARNYPVDLYFLFDLSYTMSDHKNDLARFAETLATEIGSISSNYQLGFGCFQDKVVDPFTYTIPPKLQLPHANCTSPFGFIHKLNLTREVKEFIRVVREANVTANVDAPEGGFDAIMQVAVCPNIGWRRSSRRLLIYSSDSGFHMAGDGRLGGIVVPNDGQCHLGPDGQNMAENDQDYPSVGQIAEKLRDEDISLIFAIVRSNNNGDARRDYDRLSARLEGSSVETMDNSNNVVQIVKEKYEALISKVKINTAQPSDVSVTIRSDCNTDVKLPRDNCTGLTIGRPVEFEIDIQVTECPANPADRKKVVVVSPKNINENLTIEIDMLCECPCELPDAAEANSSSCTEGNGTLACGICLCNPGRAGHMCQCALNDLGDDILGTEDCISSRDNTTCSNNGECRCGQCQCDTGFSGRYCQCRATACRNRDCGAGTCECGKCVCDEGYTGEFCECTLSQDKCRHPDNPDVLCSGFGECRCGKCVCPLGYIGTHCEICATCQSSCESYLQCANCLVTSQTEPTVSCDQQCHSVVDISFVQEAPEEGWCVMPVEDGCQVKFAIGGQGQSNVTITVLKTKVCPEPPNLVAIIAGVTGGILLLGLLLLLLWKLITTQYDRMEYARFKEEMENMKWAHEDNPIYKGATSTFHNPLLGSQDD